MAESFTQTFQFQNGSIKRAATLVNSPVYTKFQFQNGSIKSHFKKGNDLLFLMFQFQNGSIKSFLLNREPGY